MKIMVTGAGGMLGSAISERLLSGSDRDVILVTSQAGEGFEGCAQSVLSPGQLLNRWRNQSDEALGEIDLLINCAFPRSHLGEKIAEGLEFTKDLFQLAKLNNTARVINISSQSVYDQQRDESAVEETAVKPESMYGIAKYAAELLLESAYSCGQYTNIRLSSLIGPGFEQRFVNKMIASALDSGVIQISDCTSRYDFMDIRDAADAIVAMVGSDFEWEPCYVLGSNRLQTVDEIGATIASVLIREYGKDVELRITENKACLKHNSGLDATKFYQSFRWSPTYQLERTISDIASRHLLSVDDK